MCDDGPDYRAGEKAAAHWIARASKSARLQVISEIARSYVADRDPADSERRIETVLWVSSGGEHGHWHAKSAPADFLARTLAR